MKTDSGFVWTSLNNELVCLIHPDSIRVIHKGKGILPEFGPGFQSGTTKTLSEQSQHYNDVLNNCQFLYIERINESCLPSVQKYFIYRFRLSTVITAQCKLKNVPKEKQFPPPPIIHKFFLSVETTSEWLIRSMDFSGLITLT